MLRVVSVANDSQIVCPTGVLQTGMLRLDRKTPQAEDLGRLRVHVGSMSLESTLEETKGGVDLREAPIESAPPSGPGMGYQNRPRRLLRTPLGQGSQVLRGGRDAGR